MDESPEALAEVAAEAARAGGEYLAGEFRNGVVDAEFGTDDVKAVADREAERRVLGVIEDAYPDHATHGEESGRRGDDEYVWVVDPLDGTNNFASGLPSFATAVACVRDGDAVVSAIYEPLPDSLYVAIRGAGATVNGEPLTANGRDHPLDCGTVSFVVGLPAVRDDELREQAGHIRSVLGGGCKRVIETWSPCVDWGLLARGSIEGIVCFHPDVYEQYAGALLAAESGVVSASAEGLYVGAPDGATYDALRAALPEEFTPPARP